MSEPRDLLRRLAAGDEQSLEIALETPPGLDRRTRVLVRLAALLAIGAPTASLRWAVELALATGVGDDAVAAVLVSTAADTGAAQVADSASRLALALGFDVQAEPTY
jgi:4-carboxymuconolactone decarboxylase